MLNDTHLRLTLLLYPIFTSLFWSVLLYISGTKPNVPKYFLAKFLVVSCGVYITHLFLFMDARDIYVYLDIPYTFLSLIMFPLYYVYIRLLSVEEKPSLKKHLRYFTAPILVSISYAIGVALLSEYEHEYLLFEVMRGKAEAEGMVNYVYLIHRIGRLVFIVQGTYILISGFQLTRKNQNKVLNFYANTEEDSFKKVNALNLALAIGVCFGITATIIGKEQFLNTNLGLAAVTLSIGTMFFVVGWLGGNQRAILFENNEDVYESSIEEIVDTGSIQMQHIKKKLLHLFEEDKVYLNKDLTLWDLSRIIGTNRTYISTIINTEFESNFSTFVNKYRVEYAKKLLKHNPVINNQDLADAAGFGSVVSMQRAFQTIEGKSLKEIKKETIH